MLPTVLLALVILQFGGSSSQQNLDITEINVDSINGNDTSCLSFQELITNISNSSESEVTTPNTSVPCKTIGRALGNVDCNVCETNNPLSNVVVKLFDGVHTIDSCVGIILGANVTVEAVNKGSSTVKCAESISDIKYSIASCETDGLFFKGIRFEDCGPMSINVFLNRTNEVLFEDCIFTNNTGAPLRLQFVPSIKLLHTIFINNWNQQPSKEDTESTTIAQLYDSITTAGGFTYFSRNRDVQIVIENCTFSNNTANVNNPMNSRPVLFKANGHGGAVLIRLAQVSNAVINITNSIFNDNQAQVDGGAIYFSLSENFSSSSIYLSNNTFTRNRVSESSGGAISLNSFSFSFNNTYLIRNCSFSQNEANAGGAVGITLYDTSLDSFRFPDSAGIVNCTFNGNAANNEGSAVGLFSLVHVDEVGFPINFTNCTFSNNSYLSLDRVHDHSSALVSFRFPMNFFNWNYFFSNQGGGVTLLNADLRVSGEVLLDGNSAMFGGGIAMDDNCLIEIRPGVNMTFMNNFANTSGGGIYVTFPAIRYTTTIFNRLCFLQYFAELGGDVPPHEWENVSISFINNQAGFSGAAIFASDMELCRWIGNEYASRNTDNTIFGDLPDEIADLSPFHYEGNKVLLTDLQDNVNLATSPYRIYVSSDFSVVQPGEILELDVSALDQVNNSREAVWSINPPHQNPILDGLSAGNEIYRFNIPHVQALLHGSRTCQADTRIDDDLSGEFSVNFSLPGTLGFTDTLNLNISGCHPGYIINTSSCLCTCDTSNAGIIRCDGNGRYVYLKNGVWGTTSEESRTLSTASVLPTFVNCQAEGRLPGCLFQFDNPNKQCRNGRHGRLCGLCSDGYGVTLDLQACTRSEDNCAAGLSLFLVLCVLVVVVSFLILFFNIGLPNELKGVLFYAQVIGLIYRPFIILQRSRTNNAVDPLSILLNILGFSIPIPLCISTNLRAHHVALLGYISPLLALITVFLYIVAARFIKVLSNRSSLKGITFLSLFIYKYVADTSFTLISCTKTEFGQVFLYDGSLNCISSELGLFVLVGLILVVLFVAPAPFVAGYICLRRPQRFQHYADVLTNGLRQKQRWFGGWDIGRRLPFVFFGYIAVLPSLIIFLMIVAAVFILLVQVVFKPYEKQHVNIIETLLLINLVAVSVVFLNPTDNPVPQWFSTLLILLPFVYGIIYLTWFTIKYLFSKFCSKNTSIEEIGIKLRRFTESDTDSHHGLSIFKFTSQACRHDKQSGCDCQSGKTVRPRSGAVSNRNDIQSADETFSQFREPLLDS